jgi:hypothetical protein
LRIFHSDCYSKRAKDFPFLLSKPLNTDENFRGIGLVVGVLFVVGLIGTYLLVLLLEKALDTLAVQLIVGSVIFLLIVSIFNEIENYYRIKKYESDLS